jgi:hypothetical protein
MQLPKPFACYVRRWQSLKVGKWNLNHCGVKVNYLGNNDIEVNHARIKKALTITR